MRQPRVATMRLGLRLARRELSRTRGRSSLVLLMVLIPTSAMTLVVVALRTSEWSGVEHTAAELGRTDTFAHPNEGSIDTQKLHDLRAGLPDGSRLLVERAFEDRVRTRDQRVYFRVTDLPIDDPMNDGRFFPVQGRLAKSPDEVVITDGVAAELDLGIGDTFEPERLGRRVEVVGTVRLRDSDAPDRLAFVAGPIADDAFVTSEVSIDLPDRWYARHQTEAGEQPRDALSVPGWSIASLRASSPRDATAGVLWSYAGGGVGLVVVGTVIVAAFAIGARRRLRTIGLLSSTGASPGTIKWLLVAQGILLGALGSVTGIAVGIVVANLMPDWIFENLGDRVVDGVVIRTADLVPIAVIGTAAAAVAAWLPARSIARVPTLQMLAGRRPLGRVSPKLPVLGVVSIGVGCMLLATMFGDPRNDASPWRAFAAVAGGVAVILGTLAIAPLVVASLERLSRSWPDSGRIAARGLGRSRVRSSALVGAICAVAATVVTGTTLYASGRPTESGCCEFDPTFQRENQVLIEVPGFDPQARPLSDQIPAPIRRVLPGARVVPLNDLGPGFITGEFLAGRDDESSSRRSGRVGVPTPELLDVYGVPERLRGALDRGEAISVVEPPRESHEIELVVEALGDPGSTKRATLGLGGSFESPDAAQLLGTILISATRAEELGLEVLRSWTVLLKLPEPLSRRQRDALELAVDEMQWEQLNQNVDTGGVQVLNLPETPDGSEPLPPVVMQGFRLFSLPEAPAAIEVSPGLAKAGLLVLSLLLILAIVSIGFALAARDSEDERQILSAVGAPPRTLRRVGALRGVILTFAAGAIAVPAGLIPSAALVAADDSTGPFRIDWWAVVFVVAVIPLVVGAAALVGGRVRDAIRPTRPDVFAFSD